MNWSEEQYAALLARQQAGSEPPAPRRIENRPEEALQRQVVAALEALNLEGHALYWHTPSQRGTRKPWEQALLKALGVKPGVPDLIFLLDGGRVAFLELKAGKGRQSLAQVAFEHQARALGADYRVARSLDDVREALIAWGVEDARRLRLEGAA